MKLVSTVALGLMLALGTTGVMAPAFAAKKEKAPEPPKLTLGKEVRAAAAAIQADLKAQKAADAKTKLPGIAAIASTPDEKYFVGQLHLAVGQQLKDNAMVTKAVYDMIASGGAPAVELPRLNFYAGGFAYNGGVYNDALRYLLEAEKGGYKDEGGSLNLQIAESYFKLNQIAQGASYVEKAVAAETAAGRKAPENWYARVSGVAYKAKNDVLVAQWTRAQVKAYPTSDNWRSALVIYRDSTKLDGQVQLDLFRLMRDTKSLKGEKDYYDYAALATERALPGEAKSVIEEGYALGTVSKTSVAVKERLGEATGKIASDRASVTADEKRAASAPDGRLAGNTGNAYLAYGDNAKAIELLQLAQKKGGADADTVNTRLGIALARAGQKDAAKKAFAAVTGPGRKEVAQFWLLHLDLGA